MRPSNIQLQHYFVSELSVSVNRAFDMQKPVNVRLADVVADPECLVKEGSEREWQIRLRVKHTQNPESNTPYFFNLEIVGFFQVSDAVPAKDVGGFALVNGASVLFSTAREVLRSTMAHGPYEPLMLPTVCFLDVSPETQKSDALPEAEGPKQIAGDSSVPMKPTEPA